MNAKLSEKYKGSFIVRKKVSPVIFDLGDKGGNIAKHIHVKDLRLYQKGKNEEEDISSADDEQYITPIATISPAPHNA